MVQHLAECYVRRNHGGWHPLAEHLATSTVSQYKFQAAERKVKSGAGQESDD